MGSPVRRRGGSADRVLRTGILPPAPSGWRGVPVCWRSPPPALGAGAEVGRLLPTAPVFARVGEAESPALGSQAGLALGIGADHLRTEARAGHVQLPQR